LGFEAAANVAVRFTVAPIHRRYFASQFAEFAKMAMSSPAFKFPLPQEVTAILDPAPRHLASLIVDRVCVSRPRMRSCGCSKRPTLA